VRVVLAIGGDDGQRCGGVALVHCAGPIERLVALGDLKLFGGCSRYSHGNETHSAAARNDADLVDAFCVLARTDCAVSAARDGLLTLR
jgi:hypothetical protein